MNLKNQGNHNNVLFLIFLKFLMAQVISLAQESTVQFYRESEGTVLAETNKKNWAKQHSELLCWASNGHFGSKINLSLDRASKHFYLPGLTRVLAETLPTFGIELVVSIRTEVMYKEVQLSIRKQLLREAR